MPAVANADATAVIPTCVLPKAVNQQWYIAYSVEQIAMPLATILLYAAATMFDFLKRRLTVQPASNEACFKSPAELRQQKLKRLINWLVMILLLFTIPLTVCRSLLIAN